MDFSLHALLIVCPLVFLSGFVDSVAGGGGLISIPAYVFAGLPMINAYGCNKFSAALGTCVSSFKYFKSGNVHLKTALYSAVGALIGLAMPGRKKRAAAWAASLVLAASYVPLMGKFLPFLLGERVAIEDIYR